VNRLNTLLTTDDAENPTFITSEEEALYAKGDTMDLVNFAGKTAIGVSVAIVLIAVLLGALLIGCLILGAYESATNPHSATDTATELQNATSQINTGVADIARAVPSVPGK